VSSTMFGRLSPSDGKLNTVTTLKDVATQAGVSTATVSRVLHRNGYVSPDARKRVAAALRDSGYRINALAQGLRKQRTLTLGHIVHGILPNPFYAEVAMGVEHGAAEQGFHVLIYNAGGDAEREREGVETLLARRVDGIIFTTAVNDGNVHMAIKAGVSVVEVEKPLSDASASVVVDNYTGASEAMQHLLQFGHRNIGYLGEPYTRLRGASDKRADRVVRERFDAYRDALESAGIELDDSYVVLGDYWRDPGWSDLRTGSDYMDRLMRQAPNLTAVFAASDLLAAGALQALYAQGVRVPQQLSIVGFDDTFAKHLAPPLTTVRQPMFDMGLRAARLAISLISQHANGTPTEWCVARLVVRESTSRL
jgi:LacI family transcriptional regulator, galactose operon repressor